LIQLSFNTLLAHQIQNFHEENPYSSADFSNPDESIPVLRLLSGNNLPLDGAIDQSESNIPQSRVILTSKQALVINRSTEFTQTKR